MTGKKKYERLSNSCENLLRDWYDAAFRVGQKTPQILCGINNVSKRYFGPNEISRHIRNEVFYGKYSIIRLCMNCNS